MKLLSKMQSKSVKVVNVDLIKEEFPDAFREELGMLRHVMDMIVAHVKSFFITRTITVTWCLYQMGFPFTYFLVLT